MKFSLSVLVAVAAVSFVSAAEARTGYVKTADGKCHHCDTSKTPMCTALANDSLCKKYASKSSAKISLENPFGDQAASDQQNADAAKPSEDRSIGSPKP